VEFLEQATGAGFEVVERKDENGWFFAELKKRG
jgi:hypothetical protein